MTCKWKYFLNANDKRLIDKYPKLIFSYKAHDSRKMSNCNTPNNCYFIMHNGS